MSRLQGRKAPASAGLRSGRASSFPGLCAPGGRGRRRGTEEGSEGAGVAGGKELAGERRPERSEGGKMADRFSRFNEDRDFQVNRGVAEDPEKALAEQEPPHPPLPALFSSRLFRLINRLALLPPRIPQGASQLEARPHLLSPCVFIPFKLTLPRLRLWPVWASGFGTRAWPLRGVGEVLLSGLPGLWRCRAGSRGDSGLGGEALGPVLLRPGLPNP